VRRLLSILLLLLVVACSPAISVPRPHVGGGREKAPTPTATATATATALPTLPVEPTPTPAADFSVQFHPDGGLYVGDKVSMEVITPTGYDAAEKSVEVSADGEEIGTAAFSSFGIAGRKEATFTWAWDTAALEAGPHVLDFAILPAGPAWSQSVTLLPAADLPPPLARAHWADATSECCIISYITGTEAERDIASLEQMADAEAGSVEQELHATPKEKIQLVFMPRVLGHGGFASDGIYVSYLDRNYAGSSTAQVLHHEMVHWFDNKQGGELRPTMLVEGLAVYLSGGHFKPEALPPRAAALLDLDWYIPLRELTDNFYPSQHEIGYIEAGALIQYLVETYGWEAFNGFYRDMHPQPSGKQSDAMDAALQAHFGITLEQLETQWQDSLRALPPDPAARQDVVLSVQFYDTVRRYQQAFDPSAYFRTAWLPDGAEMRRQGITADFLRHPDGEANIALETLLVQADASLRAGDLAAAAEKIEAAQRMLDMLESAN
jgi:hypothetical protein